MHAWVLTSGKNIFSAHVQISDLSKSPTILKKVQKILKDKFKFYFSTVQIEKGCSDSDEAEEINV